MRTARRISQVFFIVLFFILFLLATYPLTSKLAVDVFLRSDPLAEIAASLSARTFILKSIPAFVLLILSIVLGRFFCGWICPLGTTVDGFDNLTKARYHNEKAPNLKWLKFSILIIVLLAALLSVQLVGFVDPIPLFTRTTVTFLYPLFALIIDGFMGFLMSFGFLENIAFSMTDALRGTVLPIQMIAFQGSVLIGLIFLTIIGFAFVHRRFWCRNLCPLGALYGFFSRFRWYRRRVSEDCTDCGLCMRKCRMGAIPEDYKSTDHIECINCMDCQAVCPVDAVSFGLHKKAARSKVDFSRRRVLTAGASGVLSLGLLRIGFNEPEEKGKVIRPPGAWEEKEFQDRCIRCGECVRICSTSGAGLQLAGLEAGWGAIWSPVLKSKVGYCEYNCNLCGKVCPTGAIHPLPLEERQEMKMGTAHFDKTRCIPWYYGEDCMVCEEHCPLPEKAIRFRESEVVTIDGIETTVLLPYVDETLCIGCGICVNRCPVEGERGIFLTNADEMRWM